MGIRKKNLPAQLLFLVLLVSADIGHICTTLVASRSYLQ